MSKDDLPSPGEARPKRRRTAGSGGTSFYIQRGRSFVTMSEYRDRRRTPDEKMAVSLANEITRLANDYPRFRLFLHQLQHRVLLQVRSSGWKAKAVLKVFDQHEAASQRDISKASGLDFVSVTNTLAELKAAGKITPCNRRGGPIMNPDGRRYWRKV